MISGPELEGKYEILRKIREGGMGAVYEVRHRLLDERRVIKVIHPHLVSSQELAERFRREARAASGLRHPNIAHLHDFSVDADGRAYIIMELIEGLGLDEILRTQGPPRLGLGLEISRQALRAIGFLHRRGFLHRDVSPDNLMLTRDPEGGPLVKLIDLGIAKVLVENERGLTMAGTFLGKPRYASPEHLGATGDAIDGRSDLYSLGVVIYELLTGVCPIQGDNPSALLASHLFQPPLDFAVSDPEGKLPPDLRAVLLKALAKKPADRYAGAEEMRERLGAFQGRFPWTPEDLDAVLARPQDLDATAALPRRGSTQERLDRQFLKEETPGSAVPVAVPRTEPIPGLALAPPAPPPPPPVQERRAEPAEPVLAVAPVRKLPPDEPRRRRAAWVWIAAAAAVLVLAALLFLLTGREEGEGEAVVVAQNEQPAEPVSTPSSTSSTDMPAAPEAEKSLAAEEAVQTASPVPESVSLQPAAPPPVTPPPVTTQPVRPKPEPAPSPAPPKEETRKTEPRKPAAEPVRKTEPKAEEKKVDVPVEAKPDRRPRREPAENEEEISFVEPPRQLLVPSAFYPKEASGSGAKAQVVVAILVNEKGEVAEARVTSMTIEEGATGPKGEELKSLFREAAVAAARRTRFEPARSDGVAVSYRGELNFSF